MLLMGYRGLEVSDPHQAIRERHLGDFILSF